MATPTPPPTGSSRTSPLSSATRTRRRIVSWPPATSTSCTATAMTADLPTGKHATGPCSRGWRPLAGVRGAAGTERETGGDTGDPRTRGLPQRGHVLPPRQEPSDGKQQPAGLRLRLARLPREHHGKGHEWRSRVGHKRPLPPAHHDLSAAQRGGHLRGRHEQASTRT